MKRKIQELHNIDYFQEKVKAIYYIKSEECFAISNDVKDYL